MPVKSLWTPSRDFAFVQSGTGATDLTWQGAVAGQYVVIINKGDVWALHGNQMYSITEWPGAMRPLDFNQSAQLVYDGSEWRELWRHGSPS